MGDIFLSIAYSAMYLCEVRNDLQVFHDGRQSVRIHSRDFLYIGGLKHHRGSRSLGCCSSLQKNSHVRFVGTYERGETIFKATTIEYRLSVTDNA